MHENKLSNLKKIGAQDQLEVGVSQDRDKKSSRSKGSKSRFFDYKWLKIANKDKKATPGASSKKKSSLCKSSRVIEGHQENFKSFSLNKLIPKLSLISKDHIACSERSPLPARGGRGPGSRLLNRAARRARGSFSASAARRDTRRATSSVTCCCRRPVSRGSCRLLLETSSSSRPDRRLASS